MNDDNPLPTPAHPPAIDTPSPPRWRNSEERSESLMQRREQQTGALLVKIGGSLLDWPDLPHFLHAQIPHWRAERRSIVLIVGGGRWADEIRAADQRFQLGPAAAHQLAIQVMSLTARLLVEILPEASWCGDWKELVNTLANTTADPSAQPVSSLIVLDCKRFLEHQEPTTPGSPLPHTWDSTSDSIAARVAVAAHVHELLLLKSTDIPADTDLAQAAAAGWVDAFFPIAAEPLHQIDWMNPRTQQHGRFSMSKRPRPDNGSDR
jgi:aspartokinase-like uncharacterized kinase